MVNFTCCIFECCNEQSLFQFQCTNEHEHEHVQAYRQQMTTVNLLQKHLKQLQYYTISNWYYILIQLLSVAKSSITC